jgi:hypothetical protein
VDASRGLGDRIDRHHVDLVREHRHAVETVEDGGGEHVERDVVMIDLDARTSDRSINGTDPVDPAQRVERLSEADRAVGLLNV